MIDVSDLTNKIWNQSNLPNDIKMEWSTVVADRAALRPLPTQPWLKVDFVHHKGLKYTELRRRLERYDFDWVKDAVFILNAWMMDLSMLV